MVLELKVPHGANFNERKLEALFPGCTFGFSHNLATKTTTVHITGLTTRVDAKTCAELISATCRVDTPLHSGQSAFTGGQQGHGASTGGHHAQRGQRGQHRAQHGQHGQHRAQHGQHGQHHAQLAQLGQHGQHRAQHGQPGQQLGQPWQQVQSRQHVQHGQPGQQLGQPWQQVQQLGQSGQRGPTVSTGGQPEHSSSRLFTIGSDTYHERGNTHQPTQHQRPVQRRE